MIWNDEQQKRMLVTHSVCAGACRRRSSPGAVPAMGKANGWEANPTQRKRQKTKKLTQAQKTHTLAWCYCAISQHRQLKHHTCVLKKDPTHEVDSVAAHNHHGSQYRRDSTRPRRFNTLFAKLLEKRSSEFLWSALIRVLPWTQTTITAGGLSRRPPQRLHFQSEKNLRHGEREPFWESTAALLDLGCRLACQFQPFSFILNVRVWHEQKQKVRKWECYSYNKVSSHLFLVGESVLW